MHEASLEKTEDSWFSPIWSSSGQFFAEHVFLPVRKIGLFISLSEFKICQTVIFVIFFLFVRKFKRFHGNTLDVKLFIVSNWPIIKHQNNNLGTLVSLNLATIYLSDWLRRRRSFIM